MLPLTKAIPKPMAPFLSHTLLREGLNRLKPKINNVSITVGHHAPILAKYSVSIGIDVIFNTSGKGNAWWIFNTLFRYLNEPVLVLTADNITTISYEDIYEDFTTLHQSICMIVAVAPVEGVEGDFIEVSSDDQSTILSLNRHIPSDSYASGIQVINPYLINQVCNDSRFSDPNVSFSDIWDTLILLGLLKKSKIIIDLFVISLHP